MRILLIDDLRNLNVDRVARTFQEGIVALSEEKWDLLLLDHDLGSEKVDETGYDILRWLEEHPEHIPQKIKLVTSNPAGRQKMDLVIQKMFGTL